jgi:hypothetical protein
MEGAISCFKLLSRHPNEETEEKQQKICHDNRYIPKASIFLAQRLTYLVGKY